MPAPPAAKRYGPAGRKACSRACRQGFFPLRAVPSRQWLGHEVVIQNNIGGLEGTQGLERQKLGSPGRADKGNRSSDSSSRTRSRLGKQRGKITISRAHLAASARPLNSSQKRRRVFKGVSSAFIRSRQTLAVCAQSLISRGSSASSRPAAPAPVWARLRWLKCQ